MLKDVRKRGKWKAPIQSNSPSGVTEGAKKEGLGVGVAAQQTKPPLAAQAGVPAALPPTQFSAYVRRKVADNAQMLGSCYSHGRCVLGFGPANPGHCVLRPFGK